MTLTRRIVPVRERKNFRRLDLDRLVTETLFMPPAFELIPRLLASLENGYVSCEDLAETIRIDAGLTADVLRIANSATHRGTERTETLSAAINRVGLREIYQEVVKIVASPALNSQEDCLYQQVDFWRHSLATAIAAQVLARHLRCEDPEVAFTGGLLHDLGKVLLSQAIGRDYFSLLETCALTGRMVQGAEKEAFEVDHVQAGVRLLKAWKFPERIVAGIGGHHAPLKAADGDSTLAAILYVGNAVAYRIGHGNGTPAYAAHPDVKTLQLIGVEMEHLRAYEEETVELLRREQERFW